MMLVHIMRLHVFEIIFINIYCHEHHFTGYILFRFHIACCIQLFCNGIYYMTKITFYSERRSEVMHYTIEIMTRNIFRQYLEVLKRRFGRDGKSLEKYYTCNAANDYQKTFFHCNRFKAEIIKNNQLTITKYNDPIAVYIKSFNFFNRVCISNLVHQLL